MKGNNTPTTSGSGEEDPTNLSKINSHDSDNPHEDESYDLLEEIVDKWDIDRRNVEAIQISEIPGFSKDQVVKMMDFIDYTYPSSSKEKQARKDQALIKLQAEGWRIARYPELNPDVIIFAKDQEISIAYHGTRFGNTSQFADDIATDMSALPNSSSLLSEGNQGKVHRGFYQRFFKTSIDVLDFVSKYAEERGEHIKDLRINVTGHSMGGAIANIMAFMLAKNVPSENIYLMTFAAPPLFTKSAADEVKHFLRNSVRVKDRNDFIPSLGFNNTYEHATNEVVDIFSPKEASPHPLGAHKKQIETNSFFIANHPPVNKRSILESPTLLERGTSLISPNAKMIANFFLLGQSPASQINSSKLKEHITKLKAEDRIAWNMAGQSSAGVEI